jgi:hypothetical protein
MEFYRYGERMKPAVLKKHGETDRNARVIDDTGIRARYKVRKGKLQN